MDNSDRTLYVNKSNRKFLGVCAGVADYLGTEAWVIRVVFVLGLVFGSWFIAPLSFFVWLLVPLYFVLWLCLDSSPKGSGESTRGDHSRNVSRRRGKLYRSKKKGKLLGVCAGVANYLEVSVFLVRLLTVVGFFMSGMLAGVIYVGAYFILDDEPEENAWGEGHTSNANNPGGDHPHRVQADIQQCEHKLRALRSRLARMEAYTTSRHYKLNREFRDLS